MNIQVRPVSYGTYQGFVPNRGEQAQIKKDLMDDSHVSYWDLVHSFAVLKSRGLHWNVAVIVHTQYVIAMELVKKYPITQYNIAQFIQQVMQSLFNL